MKNDKTSTKCNVQQYLSQFQDRFGPVFRSLILIAIEANRVGREKPCGVRSKGMKQMLGILLYSNRFSAMIRHDFASTRVFSCVS